MLVCSDSRSTVSYINHQGGLVSKRLCTLANDLLVWAENNLVGWRWRICRAKWTKEQTCCRGPTSLEWTLHRLTVQKIWEIFGKAWVDLFASKDNSHCPMPNLFYKEHGCPGPQMALCFSPNRSATAGTQASQGTTAQASFNSPPLEEPTVGVRIIPAADSSPVDNPPDTGPPLSSERHNMASTARVMGPACVAARREPFSLPERVLNTMAEAGAPSTRCLYALKLYIFLAWCQDRDLEPVTSEVSVVLSFLQERLDKQGSSSTIKVNSAAIAAFHAPIASRSVGRDSAVIQFLRGASRMTVPEWQNDCSRTVPPWDLPTVLRALKGPPFEPLQSSSLRVLSLKTTLLLALASVKRVGDLQALSVNPACLEFGPNDSKVILKPRLGYVPKVLSTPFRAQVKALFAFSPLAGSQVSLFCPIRPLKIYIERSASYRKSEQLFVDFSNRDKGGPVMKQRIYRWLVDAITLVYSSMGSRCPIGIRAHSTRGIASSWAWSSRVSMSNICEAAGWSSPSTFVRIYNPDIPTVQATVLSA